MWVVLLLNWGYIRHINSVSISGHPISITNLSAAQWAYIRRIRTSVWCLVYFSELIW
jgi:hypothetical protein